MLDNYEEIKECGGRYVIAPSGDVVQLRMKSNVRLDLKGHFIFMDYGDKIKKKYIYELLINAYGNDSVNDGEAMLAFMESITPRLRKKMTWAMEGNALIITLSVRTIELNPAEQKMSVHLIRDLKDIFSIHSKYGRLFLKGEG